MAALPVLLALVSSSVTRAAPLAAVDSLNWTQVVADSMSRGYARGEPALVFDSRRNRVLALCGANVVLCDGAARYYEDVRIIDPSMPTGWDTLPIPRGTGPRRRGAAAAFDSLGDRVYLFGGIDSETGYVSSTDLWILDLATNQWSQVAAVGTAPAPRWTHSLTLDPIRRRLILFGGLDWNVPLGDVWEMPLTQPGAWVPLTPAGMPPAPRGGHLAAYDPGADRIVVVGGTNLPAGDVGKTWSLSLAGGAAWTLVSASGGPFGWTMGGMDARRGRLISVSLEVSEYDPTIRVLDLATGQWGIAVPGGAGGFPFLNPVLPQSRSVVDPSHDLLVFSWDGLHLTGGGRTLPCSFNESGTTFRLHLGAVPIVTVTASLDSVGFAFGHAVGRWSVSLDRAPWSLLAFESDWRGSYQSALQSVETTASTVVHTDELVPVAAPYHARLRWFDGQQFQATSPVLISPPPPPANVKVSLQDNLGVAGGWIRGMLHLDSDSLWYLAPTILDRRKGGGAWEPLHSGFPDLDGSFGIIDGNVLPNTVYEYRVRWRDDPPPGSPTFSILTPPWPVFDSSHVEPRRIAIYWHSLPGANLVGRIKKSAPMGEGWPDTIDVQTNAEGRIIFIDDQVEPATYYNYQLTWFEGGAERLSTDIGLATPHETETPDAPIDGLTLSAPYPNPSAGAFQSTIMVPAGAPASADLIDIAGRRRWSGTLPAGASVLQVPALSLESGIYSLIVRQGSATRKRRVVIME
jgi:hypothetical protein